MNQSLLIAIAIGVAFMGGIAGGVSISMTLVRMSLRGITGKIDVVLAPAPLVVSPAAPLALEPDVPIDAKEPPPGVEQLVFYRKPDGTGETRYKGTDVDAAVAAWIELEMNAEQYPGVHEYWQDDRLRGFQRYPRENAHSIEPGATT